MKDLIDNLKRLGRGRLALMGGTALGITLALVVGLSLALSPSYRPLVTDVSAGSASRMMSELEGAGFKPRASSDGTMISLPEADIARARMTLAQAGLPAEGNAGWELFDNASGIGMNSFLQRVNRLRALEGELGRSIETIDNVGQARVHLVLPERETFSQDRPEPSASAVVHAKKGRMIDRRQAKAIRSMIAASVPGLVPGRVTILSGTGEAILTEGDDRSSGGIASARAEIEERLRSNVENILSPYVGFGNVHVRVAAELNTSREVVVAQTFDPDQQVARSTSSTESQSRGRDGSNGTVDVANNIPGYENGGDGGGGRREERSSSSEESVFEIGNTRSERITEAGGVKRLTVAVVVNSIENEDGTFTDRSPEEMDRLNALVRSAAGIDENRGDTVTVDSLQFASGPDLSAQGSRIGIIDLLLMNFGTILRALSAVGIVAAILFLAVRPALRRIAPLAPSEGAGDANTSVQSSAERGQDAGSDPTTASATTEGAGGTAVDGGDSPDMQEDVDVEYVSIASVSGSVMRRHIEELAKLTEREPEATMRTIRGWINQKG